MFFGVLAALFCGLAVLFTVGETAAVAVVVVLVALVVAGFFVGRSVLQGLVAVVVVAFLASAFFVGNGVLQLVAAFSTTEGRSILPTRLPLPRPMPRSRTSETRWRFGSSSPRTR